MPTDFQARRHKLFLPGVSAFLLGGCGMVDAIFTPPDWAGGEIETFAPEPVEPVEPIDANRFELADDTEVVGRLQVVRASADDTFVDIARSYGLGFDELVQANPDVDPWLPGEGTPVILPTRFVLPSAPREGVVLNVASKRLFYYPPAVGDEPRRVETFPIGIGREGWATPTGETEVVSKARDPVWFVPASIRKEHAEAGDPLPPQVPPGPDNPLGTRVLGLGLPGYLIHGTNKPAGVGMRVSHGCVRLFPEDIEYLYEELPVGTPVRIVNQPYLVAWQQGELLLEAHPPLEEDERDWPAALPEIARAAVIDAESDAKYSLAAVDEARLAEVAVQQRGLPVSVLASGGVDAALARAQPVHNVVTYAWLDDESDTSVE
jgi:L,D-transpeptidase ErfK/SrfK